MTIEKNAEIREGLTPPEDSQKDVPLEEHVTKRASDAAKCRCKQAADCQSTLAKPAK
jgi:hypothetical protein